MFGHLLELFSFFPISQSMEGSQTLRHKTAVDLIVDIFSRLSLVLKLYHFLSYFTARQQASKGLAVDTNYK